MQNLLIGGALLLLALLVGVAFYLELTGSGFGVDRPPGYEQDDVRFLDEDDGSTTATLETERNPLLEQAQDQNTNPLLREGVIAPWDKNKVDADGYFHYTVQPYDTLSEIARVYLGKARLWRVIRDHNPEIIDPRDIQAGMTIKIPLWLREG